MISDALRAEASAFDERILERVRNGLIPDLQNAASIDWFYNNPWRRPEYVKMIFGEYLEFADSQLPAVPARILEMGSGLGHMCLELGRRGHDVTGVELSPESVRIASDYYAGLKAEWRGRGAVSYVNDDFMSWQPDRPFDAVCFFLTLHHFEDLPSVIERVKSFLRPGGTIIVVEPARDLFSFRDAAVASLIRLLLSAHNGWHEKLELPQSPEALKKYVHEVWAEYREAKEKGEHDQSPHDNSSFAADILQVLKRYFYETKLSYGNTLTPRLLGGVRGESEAKTRNLASFLKVFDVMATEEKILEPGVVYFAGKLID